MFVPNCKILGQVVPEKSLTKISIFITSERLKKGKNRKRRHVNLGTLVLFTVMHLIVYTKSGEDVTPTDAELIRWKKCWK